MAMTEHRLDPLGDLEVKRVLAFARAREQYPTVPRGLLLDYCQAAWQAAVAGGGDHDVLGRFERALMMVAWTHRRSPHLSFRDLVDQVIPQVALRPFMSPQNALPAEEPEGAAVAGAGPAGGAAGGGGRRRARAGRPAGRAAPAGPPPDPARSLRLADPARSGR